MQAATPCVGGFAGTYPCNNVDLLAFMPLASIGGGGGNDIWGWTDSQTGKEYALMGRTTGTSFVDISEWFFDSPAVRIRTILGDGSLVETWRRFDHPPVLPLSHQGVNITQDIAHKDREFRREMA